MAVMSDMNIDLVEKFQAGGEITVDDMTPKLIQADKLRKAKERDCLGLPSQSTSFPRKYKLHVNQRSPSMGSLPRNFVSLFLRMDFR